jgi:hypothetical protein
MRLPRRAVLISVWLPCVVLAAERPSLAVFETAGPIRIDGVLDEPAWAQAPVAGEFVLMSPREGEAPEESTTVRVLRAGDRLVFGIWCQAKRKPHAGLTARDNVLDGDHISVHVDTDGDGQHAYIFGVNPYGVQVDGILGTGDPDFKWDGVWDSATRRSEGGWTAEIEVPFRILRISAHGRPWRVWVRREITSWNEVATWPPYKVGEAGPIMLQAADLEGLDGAHGGRELSIEPYVYGARLDTRDLLATGGTSAWSHDPQREAGADLQAGVTRSLVLNATYNPDFSQIEADALQIDVNRRFPLIYPEKRPFFLEGADHFLTLMDLVLTRRMADPDGGMKLTGRAGGWNTGALVVRASWAPATRRAMTACSRARAGTRSSARSCRSGTAPTSACWPARTGRTRRGWPPRPAPRTSGRRSTASAGSTRSSGSRTTGAASCSWSAPVRTSTA